MSESLTTVVEPGEVEVLVPSALPATDLYLSVEGGDAYLGRTVDSARSGERLVKNGDRGPLKVPERDEQVYAHVPSSAPGSVTFRMDQRGFFFNLDPRFSQDVSGAVNVENSAGATVDPATEATAGNIDAALGNWDTLIAGTHTTSSTGAESLPSNAVPDGVKVLVQALDANSGVVNVGDSSAQPIALDPGESFTLNVTNTDVIHVQTPTNGDGVGFLAEA